MPAHTLLDFHGSNSCSDIFQPDCHLRLIPNPFRPDCLNNDDSTSDPSQFFAVSPLVVRSCSDDLDQPQANGQFSPHSNTVKTEIAAVMPSTGRYFTLSIGERAILSMQETHRHETVRNLLY